MVEISEKYKLNSNRFRLYNDFNLSELEEVKIVNVYHNEDVAYVTISKGVVYYLGSSHRSGGLSIPLDMICKTSDEYEIW